VIFSLSFFPYNKTEVDVGMVYKIEAAFVFRVIAEDISEFGDLNEWAKLCDSTSVTVTEREGAKLVCSVGAEINMDYLDVMSITDFEKKVRELLKMLKKIERDEKKRRGW